MKARATIAIDPGSQSGLAAWCELRLVHRELVEVGQRRSPMSRLRAAALRRAIAACGGLDECDIELVVEGQFLGGSDPRRFAAAVSVAEDARAWEVVGELLGLSLANKRPPQQSWRSDFGLGKRSLRARTVVDLVELHEGALPASRVKDAINIAEAVCIGLYHHRKRVDGLPQWHVRDLRQNELPFG